MHSIPERRSENKCEGCPFTQGCPLAKASNWMKNAVGDYFQSQLACNAPETKDIWIVWDIKRKREVSRALIVDLAHRAAYSNDLTLRN